MPDVGVNRCRANPDEHLMVPTAGSSTSRSSRTSGEPYLFWTIAFILAPLVVQVLEHVAERDVQRGSAREALEPSSPSLAR